jgi:heme exporter protein A
LERVGLGLRQDDLVQTFSRGMRQRLAVARAVLHEPQVLLLDEPYTGLDPQAVDMVRDLLVELAGTGCTILMTTHRLTHALAAARRIVVIHHGRVVLDEPRDGMEREAFPARYRALTG